MSYWKVLAPPDSLALYAWGDNAQHALRKVEEFAGPQPPQRVKVTSVAPEQIPEGAYVIDEPLQEMEVRTDGVES